MTSRLIATLAPALLLLSCGKAAGDRPIGKAIEIAAPLGLPPVPIPADNPPTAETLALGKKLYFDPRLSSDGSVSCASCHSPEHGFSDGRKTAMGVRKQFGKRNAPAVVNAAYSPRQFWDGRAASLEEQAAGPIANPIEMDLPHTECAVRINDDPEYKTMFAKAFGHGAITMPHIQKAIATYERTVLSGGSAVDRYLYGGEKSALSEAAIRGLNVFMSKDKGNCAACHVVKEDFALFTDGLFHNIGVGLNAEGELTDLGRYEQTHAESDKGAFKTPSLRNVAKSGPYMHDGSLKTLRTVVDFYVGGGSSNPYLDKRIKPLTLSGQEREDLVAFLEALTSEPKMVR
ncbi:MAG: cytochrome-c peroxidase [Acidobacteria bacterium]|nr:cytochrome-c peroxidase [Acidobacteriota bacterium]